MWVEKEQIKICFEFVKIQQDFDEKILLNR